MGYIDKLNAQQINNAKLIIKQARAQGITNDLTIAALLSIASKESELKPQNENLKYSAKRIMEVWKKTPPDIAKKLENNPQELANYFYGGKGGNTKTNAYMYRGRGFNQITFAGMYKKIGDIIGVDLVNNPDLLNNPDTAAAGFIAYYKLIAKGGGIDLNKLNTEAAAIDTVYSINSGALHKAIKDTTGGYQKAKDRFNEFLTFVNPKHVGTSKIVNIALILLVIGGAIYLTKK